MVFFRSFNLHLAFLTFFFLLALIPAIRADDEKPFTQAFIEENQDVITAFTHRNPYLNSIANGTATKAEFERDIIQGHRWLYLWARSLGYALTRAPVPVPKDWGFGDVPDEFFIDILCQIVNSVEEYASLLKGLAKKHNFDIYGEPISAAAQEDGDFIIKVAKKLPFETYIAENWAGVRFVYDGFTIVQEAIKKNGYKYEFQDYIDIISSPSFKNSSDQFELLTNTIYKSKKVDRKLATEIVREHIKRDNALLADNVNAK
ncbi:5061_t:CDS:1 [Acaulospora morrowiae]|uniref:5061_t:CDS:1 n=1 Tax=Acaulospora morrowiae TaxID=94023 RepID=A0A9N9FFU1_9GLOM|nr:5061_t:CDS:1 [Acaulospora morrowiae]